MATGVGGGLNPVPRYQALARFGERHGLERETKEWHRRLAALTGNELFAMAGMGDPA